MYAMPSQQQLRDLYRFPGFVPWPASRSSAAMPKPSSSWILRRRQKKRPAACGQTYLFVTMTTGHATSATWPVATGVVYLAFAVRRVHCGRRGGVKTERLDSVGQQPLLYEAVRLVWSASVTR